jgi:hypothetical protein
MCLHSKKHTLRWISWPDVALARLSENGPENGGRRPSCPGPAKGELGSELKHTQTGWQHARIAAALVGVQREPMCSSHDVQRATRCGKGLGMQVLRRSFCDIHFRSGFMFLFSGAIAVLLTLLAQAQIVLGDFLAHMSRRMSIETA